MSANRPEPTETTPPVVPAVDADPAATNPSRFRRVVGSVMRTLVVRPEFQEDVTASHARIMSAAPPSEFDPVAKFSTTHREAKGRHTDPRPEPEAPDPHTVAQSGRERYRSLKENLKHDHLREIRAQMGIWEDAYPNIGADRETFEASIAHLPWGRRSAATKAWRAYQRLVHHEHGILEHFGLDPHEAIARHNTQPAPRQRTPEAQSINTLAKLKGDIDTVKRKIHDKSRFINEYAGDLGQKVRIKRERAERDDFLNDLRTTREELNKHTYTHLRDHDPDAEVQGDGSILIRGANINNIPGTWAVYEDGRSVQLADDGRTVLAMYRPNGVRYRINHDVMRQKLEADLLREPHGADKLKEYIDSGRDLIGDRTDFEAKLQSVDIDAIDELGAETQRLQDLITQKRSNGEDITDDLRNLRNLNTRLNMARYDYLYNSPRDAERPYEGVVVMREPAVVDGVWGEWALFEDGSGVCHDQDGEVAARYNPDGSLRSMRSDPYATIDGQPPRDPSGDTLDAINTQIRVRQEAINEAREFVAVNRGNPAFADNIQVQENFIHEALEDMRELREDHNVTLYEQLRVNLPANAQVRRDGAIITDTTMNGYTGRWVINEDGSALYLGRNVNITDPDDNSQIKPLARFHRNGYRYL